MKRYRSRKGAPGVVDVAIRAGVSPATVSRAFMTPDMLRPETRQSILKAAGEIGYVRERSSGTMRNRFSGTIGLVLPTIDNAIFAELADAFSTALQAQGRTMLIATHDYDLSKEVAIVHALVERRIDGIALVGFDHDDVPLEFLAQRQIPVLSLWNYRADSTIPCIGADNFKAGSLVAEHILDLGHTDPILLFPKTGRNDRARDRLAGAMTAAAKRGLEFGEKRIFECPYDVGEAKKLATKLFVKDRPSAVICANDVIAQGVIYACIASGLSVPHDISVVGIGDFRGAADMEPALSTVRLPARRIGQLGAQTLVRMSETGGPPKPRSTEAEVTLIARTSTAPHQT
ncbi:substrate-binding domain-containing protein [Ahrensia sp. R2A130]|uniref:LacI family DNA-binding transcriptional regulator n=1 Tax=Ahrensia sp. R2A130 TaxID=744979 RepID=UPI0001E0D840|nr:substrate-binding domain-containing protein [Ahrensia sp. R2A130]EFL89286.1 periplasmic binding protein/LacI transcriptional regulator [Ahrensia sp. R2A130]